MSKIISKNFILTWNHP